MEKRPKFIAFSTQKGGVGKTTFTVLAASYLHYVKKMNVAVVDCDFPQFSINVMRKRDMEKVNADEHYQRLLIQQFEQVKKKAYPVLTASPADAIQVAETFIENNEQTLDFVFFDLPGTVNSAGVISSIAQMDYIFTPITADKVVMESTLPFVSTIHENIILRQNGKLKSINLFWNQVDGREKTELYELYEKVINVLGLPLLKTFVPDTKRYKKELSEERKSVFRSTLFPADKRLMAGSNLEELMLEIMEIVNR